jgi:hypothetical protein
MTPQPFCHYYQASEQLRLPATRKNKHGIHSGFFNVNQSKNQGIFGACQDCFLAIVWLDKNKRFSAFGAHQRQWIYPKMRQSE